MTFNALGAVLAASLTSTMADRRRAEQLTLVGGLMGSSALGLVLVAGLAQQAQGAGTTGTTTGGVVPAGGGTPVRVAIPAVAGLSVAAATKELSSVGLVAASADAVSEDPAGQVISAEPAEGTVVAAGSRVTLVVSIGTRVPDVVGQQVKQAKAEVEAAGFEAEVVGVERPGSTSGVVLSQDPQAGSYLSSGATVVLTARKRSEAEAAEAFEEEPAPPPVKGVRSKPPTTR